MGEGADLLMQSMIDEDVERMLLQEEYELMEHLIENGWWVMRDGTRIKFTKMTGSHLRNAIKMIDSNMPKYNELQQDLAGQARFRMVAELKKRYPPVDPAFMYG